MKKYVSVLGKSFELPSMVAGAVALAALCGAPVVGDYLDKGFTFIRDSVSGVFSKMAK